MPCRRLSTAILAIVSTIADCVDASPGVKFPINSQVPPVARVLRPFSFQFSESTFAATSTPLSYSISSQPSWLQLESASRTLLGIPAQDDLGPLTFQLSASDTEGLTSLNVTLIVVRDTDIVLGETVLAQLETFGRASSPASLLLHPQQAFSFAFSPNTFLGTTTSSSYYATSDDNSPLPSWLEFDPLTLHFSGATPPLVSPATKSQYYGIRLMASEMKGFAEAVTTFEIVIEYHSLTFSRDYQVIDVMIDQNVDTGSLHDELTLDGKAVASSDLSSITSDAPPWLNLDTQRIALTGVPSAGATSQNVTVFVVDVHGDTANTTIAFYMGMSSTKLFSGTVPTLNASVGTPFDYKLSPSLLLDAHINMSASLGNASSWLSFDSTDFSFSGDVPETVSPGLSTITLTATSGTFKQSLQFYIDVIQFAAPSSTATKSTSQTTDHSGTPSATSSPSGLQTPQSGSSGKRKNEIILAVILPILILLLCVCIFLYWRLQRHRAKAFADMNASRPIINEEARPEIDDIPRISSMTPQRKTTPNEPPCIELPWAPDSLLRTKQRLSKFSANHNSFVLNSGWGEFVVRDLEPRESTPKGSKTQIHELKRGSKDFVSSVKDNTPNYSRKRTPLEKIQPNYQEPSSTKRASRALSAISAISSGLPGRLSGAGHGAGGPAITDYQGFRSSWRSTQSSFPSEDSQTRAEYINAFPKPPQGKERNTHPHPNDENLKMSLRLVPSISSLTDSFADQREKWYTDRRRDPFERTSRFSHPGIPEDAIISLSRGVSATLQHDEGLGHGNTQQRWSQSSSLALSPMRTGSSSPHKAQGAHISRRSSQIRRVVSARSSGQFDSAESEPNSTWEYEELAVGKGAQGSWQWALDAHKGSRPRIPLEDFPRQSRASARVISPTGKPARPSGERRLRLGNARGRRPISIDQGELQRSQGSQKGSLAFI